MSKGSHIIGLDVGSGKIRTIVGEIQESQDTKPKILGVGISDSAGIRKGNVVDVEDAVSSISNSLEKAERMTGIAVNHALVSISGSHITSEISKGVIAVSRADGEIGEDDVGRAIEAAQAVSLPPNHEIIHVVPKQFIVDNQDGIKDPIGMNGVRLEVEAHVIMGATGFIRNLTKCVYRTGVDVDDLVLAPLAAADAVLDKRQKELGVVLVDIGEGKTGVTVYEEGDLLHTSIIPVGAGHITNDIALELRTSVATAEKVKLEYGTAILGEVSERDKIDLSSVDETEDEIVSRYHVAEVIEARISEIFNLVNKELKQIGRDGKLPAGVVVVGGGAKMPGIVELAKKELKLPAQIGLPKEFPTIIDSVNDPSFATAVGLVMWGMRQGMGSSRNFGFSGNASVSQTIGKMKGWFKNLLP